MPAKDERLIDSQGKLYNEYNETLKQLLTQAKIELDTVNHNLLLAQNNLKLTNESIVRQKNEFDIWKRQKEQEFSNINIQKTNDLVAREHALQKNEENISRRLTDLQTIEVQALGVANEKNQIANDRVEIQKLRVKAEQLMQEAATKMNEANHIINLANNRQKEADDIKTKYDSFNIEMTNREAMLKDKLKEWDLMKKNLDELKLIVEPKIKEIDAREVKFIQREDDLKKKEDDVNRKLVEDKTLFLANEEKEKKLDAKKRELLTKEEEINRKLLLIGAGK